MTCLTCHHFIEVVEECDLAPGQRPPARVIVMGCPSHTHSTEVFLEQQVRSGKLDFTANPRPAPKSIPASVISYNAAKPKPAMDLDNWNDDIPF